MAKMIGLITGKQFNDNYNKIVGIDESPDDHIIVIAYERTNRYQSRYGAHSIIGHDIKNLTATDLTKQYKVSVNDTELPEEPDDDLSTLLNELRVVANRHLANRSDELRV